MINLEIVKSTVPFLTVVRAVQEGVVEEVEACVFVIWRLFRHAETGGGSTLVERRQVLITAAVIGQLT